MTAMPGFAGETRLDRIAYGSTKTFRFCADTP
jgi:hypothetical protein